MEENKVIEFSEELTVEDLQKANYYNFKKQKKYLLNQIIFIAMALLLIGVSIADKNWLFLGIGVVIFLFSVFLFIPLYKKMIYTAVKRNIKENLKIKISFENDGFSYLLETESSEDYPKFSYNQVIKVYNVKDYIYMYFSNSSIAIIKKENCEEILELEELINEKYKDSNKYIIDEKTSF